MLPYVKSLPYVLPSISTHNFGNEEDIASWDRARARQLTGGGLPASPFRLRGGFTIPPWPRFPRPPYNAGRPDFPGPVSSLGLSSMGLPSLAGVEALVHIHPVVRGLPIASFHYRVGFAPALCLAAALLDPTANCPHSLCPMSVFPPTGGDVYAVSCEDITPRSSLLRTHSPIPSGSSFLRP